MMTLVWSSSSRDKADRVRKYLIGQGVEAETAELHIVLVHAEDADRAEDLIADATDEGGD